MRSTMILAACILATGCGIAAKVDARNKMENSRDAYKACLAQNPEAVGRCEAARLSYEAERPA